MLDAINNCIKLEEETDEKFTHWIWKSCHTTIERTCSSPENLLLRVVPTKFEGKECRAIIMKDLTHTKELESAREEKKHQQTLLGSLTHELRTPLNGIVGMLDLLEKEVRSVTGKKHWRVAKASTELMIILVEDILDLAQIEAGNIKINQGPFNVRQAISECMDLLIERFEKRSVALQFFPDSSVPKEVICDKQRYKQILLNLLSNALKFTLSGSVTIAITYNAKTEYLITEVTDTGVGINEEEITQLFKPFGRLDRTLNINPHGIGFGLSTCKRLTELLGGNISIVSVPGKGSTFNFNVIAKYVQEESKDEEDKMLNSDDISLKACDNFDTEDEGTAPHETRGFFSGHKLLTEPQRQATVMNCVIVS